MIWKSTYTFAAIYMCLPPILAMEREYFIAIEEIEWDYGPSEAGRSAHKKYTKAVFRQYTDNTFTVKSPRDPGLGLYGPIIKGEVGDVLSVHALNRASREYSLHPHGVFYFKDAEGALYTDKTKGAKKEDDAIPPRGSHTYAWEIREQYGPGPDDPNCLPWVYHSHVDTTKDQHSGLIGTLLTCRNATLTSDGERTDGVDREFPIIAFEFDENVSWYAEHNAEEEQQPHSDMEMDGHNARQNHFYTLNGKRHLGIDGLEMCKGDLVHWYMIGMGSKPHSLQPLGNTFIIGGHRADTVVLQPATFETAIMKADNPGNWTLGCQYANHFGAGMHVPYTVWDESESCMQETTDEMSTALRKYFIAAEEEEWDYGPIGIDLLRNVSLTLDGLPSATYFKKGSDRIGGVYTKAVYRGYSNESFVEKVAPNPLLGIMGPLIAAEVGETIEVMFKNKASRPFNVEPHGVFTEGISPAVPPGETRKYIWRVPDSVSPTSKDFNCVPYLYTSLDDDSAAQHTGLIGPMLICKTGTLEAELQAVPKFILLANFDENESPYLEQNIEKVTGDASAVDKMEMDFMESNILKTVNGHAFGNFLGFHVCAAQTTNIYLLTIGGDINTHSFVFDGSIVRHRSEYVGMAGVFPHAAATVTVYPYEVGASLYGCGVATHGHAGMYAFYEAKDCGTPTPAFTSSANKTVYIGAVEEVWDYLPNRTDQKGRSVDDSNHPAYLQSRQENGKFIGTKYKKVIYYEYTNDSFTERKPKPTHFGFHGPLVRMEIGDQVEVVFKNMATRPYNVQGIGIHIEGGMKGPQPVALPGEIKRYTWQARPEFAPSENQPDCFVTQYVSFVDFYDIPSGLHGPILICRRGTLNLGKGGGADEEFYLYFLTTDEGTSHYIDDNIRDFAKADPATFDKRNRDFIESNKMNHFNGRMYHLPGLEMKKGDLVRWHLIAEGEEDVHPIHFHANAFTHQTDKEVRGDVIQLQAGRDATVMMKPDAIGVWLLHCHSNTHSEKGMVTTYTVSKASSTTATSAVVWIVLCLELSYLWLFQE